MDLIIFDVDGTLVDSQDLIFAGMQRAFGQLGLAPPDRAAALATVGLSLPAAMAQLRPDADAATVAGLVEAYKSGFFAQRSAPDYHEPMFDGARAQLARLALRADCLLGVATGKSRRGVDHIVAHHGLEGLFVTVQTADGHPSKPHPSMILAALAETGAAPQRTVMVGDSSFDMEMARAAGVHAIGVTWGYQSPASLERAGAHALVESFAGLDMTLTKLLGWS